jgi:hypothetical protein
VAQTHDDNSAETTPGGKGKPTPRRKDREAELKRPLVSNNRKEAKAKLAVHRERARIGMANGEDRFLPQRDKGPQRKWTRDCVDSRLNFGEFLIPVMFAVIIATFLPSVEAQFISIAILWGFFLLTILDSIWVGSLVRKGLREKYGVENVENGVRWYAAMRALQMRGLRLPKPQVKRGEKPS